MDTIISVKDLHKYYRMGDQVAKALNGVTFDINRGEFCAIIGPSGSGKSTLLNMIAGLEPLTKGEITILGEQVENFTENQWVAFRRKHVGFIFQSYNLFPTMTALDNVAMPMMFRGVELSQRRKIAQKYLEMVGLGDATQKKGNEMSGGQQQRVGIARALATNPEIIFADEPTGNLDTKSSMDVLNILRDVVERDKTTLIMVTHDKKMASYASRQIRIVDGQIDYSDNEVV